MKSQSATIIYQDSERITEENIRNNLEIITKYLTVVQNCQFIKDSIIKLFANCKLPDRHSKEADSGGDVGQYSKNLQDIDTILQKNEYLLEFEENYDSETNYSNSGFVCNFDTLKCLGIGSISQDKSSKFQLCYILLIQHFYRFDRVCFYDPVFNDLDKYLLEKIFNFRIDLCENEESVADQIDNDIAENIDTRDVNITEDGHTEDDLVKVKNDDNYDNKTLYFLPHFPIAEFEKLVRREKPRLIIGNDIVAQLSHKGLFSENLRRYPNLMMMVMMNKDEGQGPNTTKDHDGFQTVDNFYTRKNSSSCTKKKKKKKKKRGKSLVVEFEEKEQEMKQRFLVENQGRQYYKHTKRQYWFPDHDEVPSFNDLCLFLVE